MKGRGCTPEHLPAEQGWGWLSGDLAGHCHSLPHTLHTLSPLQAILSMLQDMNFINNYKMDRQTLTR